MRLKAIKAGRGRRSPKSGQSDYFVGYKKHTLTGFISLNDGLCPVPLYSLARSASKADVEMLKPLLNFAKRRFGDCLPMNFVLGDKGYVSAPRAKFLRENWNVALIVKPKSDMRPPAGTDTDGCPVCPLGRRLIWDEYDPLDGTLVYRACEDSCTGCSASFIRPAHFEFSAADHETFWGMIPSHSRLAKQLMRTFRPRIESGFNAAKNSYGLSQLVLNSLTLTQQLCTMTDVVHMLKILAADRTGRPIRHQIKQVNVKSQLEIWDEI